jgi:hypothetical protein
LVLGLRVLALLKFSAAAGALGPRSGRFYFGSGIIFIWD